MGQLSVGVTELYSVQESVYSCMLFRLGMITGEAIWASQHSSKYVIEIYLEFEPPGCVDVGLLH